MQEAAVTFLRSLVVTSGVQIVPQLQNLPVPSCNRAEDFTLFHRGGAPDALRCVARQHVGRKQREMQALR